MNPFCSDHIMEKRQSSNPIFHQSTNHQTDTTVMINYPKLECSDAEKVHDTNAMQNLIFSILDWK